MEEVIGDGDGDGRDESQIGVKLAKWPVRDAPGGINMVQLLPAAHLDNKLSVSRDTPDELHQE